MVLRNAIWTYGKATSKLRPLPGLPDPRRAEGRHDRALRLPAPAPDDHRPVLEGGQLLRPALRARAELVPRQLPESRCAPAASSSARRARATSSIRSPRERVKELLPEARLIALVRNPVDRALSHYNHEVALGREPLSFEDALAAEEERLQGEDARLRADPALLQPRVVEPHLQGARQVRGAARALARSLPAGAAADRPERGARSASRSARTRRSRVPRRVSAPARVVPARLRAAVRGDEAGDPGQARRRLRRAEPAPLRAARPRPRLEVAGRPRHRHRKRQ